MPTKQEIINALAEKLNAVVIRDDDSDGYLYRIGGSEGDLYGWQPVTEGQVMGVLDRLM